MGDIIQPSSAEEKIAVLQRQLNQAVRGSAALRLNLLNSKIGSGKVLIIQLTFFIALHHLVL